MVDGQSYETFTISGPTHIYYVNDGTPDHYTTVPGSNGYSGTDAAHPKLSIAGILASYTLGMNDEILVDSGTYIETTNTLLTSKSNDYKILGWTGPGDPTILDRDNPNYGSYSLEMQGAQNVTIGYLSFMGGTHGIYGDQGAVSTGVYVEHDIFYDNNTAAIDLESTNDHATVIDNTFIGNSSQGPQPTGVIINADYATVTGNTVSATSGTGIEIQGNNAVVTLNTIDQTGTGINVQGNNALVSENLISNGGTGITVAGSNAQVTNNTAADDGNGIGVNGSNMLVTGNTDYGGSSGFTLSGSGQASSNLAFEISGTGIDGEGSGLLITNNTAFNDGVGITVGAGSEASQNLVHNSGSGITVDPNAPTATISDNRVYACAYVGIDACGYAVVTGNYVYNNGIGIIGEPASNNIPWLGTIEYNLVYNDATQGILIHDGQGALVLNNTVYEPLPSAADAVTIDSASVGMQVLNNILWVLFGHDLNIAADSERQLNSDFNDVYATGSGSVGYWEQTAFPTLTDWFYSVGQDEHSLSVDPQFINPAGPNGILGYSTLPTNSPPQIIDDSSTSGFQLTGTWTPETGSGYDSTYDLSNSSDNTDLATYTFTGLTPGLYQVAATWPVVTGVGSATYSVFDGSQNMGGVNIDQSQAPSGFTSGGAIWQVVNIYYISGTTLTVKLAPQSMGGTIVADAVRLQQLYGDAGTDDNFHLQATSALVDWGSLTTDYLNEPAPNGGRANIGYDGNTSQAQTSSVPELQVLYPTYGNEKLQMTHTYTISWRSDGLYGPSTGQDAPGYYASDVLSNDSPYAFYRLNEANGSTAADSSGNGLNGTYAATGVTLGAHGALQSDSDTSALLDGNTGNVNLPSGFSNYANGFSFDVWVYPTANNGEQFFSLGDGNSSDVVELGNGANSNDLVFTVGNTSVTATDAISLDQWQYFAVTLTPTGGFFNPTAAVMLYKNGVQIANGSTNLPANVARNSNFLGMGTVVQSFFRAADAGRSLCRCHAGGSLLYEHPVGRPDPGPLRPTVLRHGQHRPVAQWPGGAEHRLGRAQQRVLVDHPQLRHARPALPDPRHLGGVRHRFRHLALSVPDYQRRAQLLHQRSEYDQRRLHHGDRQRHQQRQDA